MWVKDRIRLGQPSEFENGTTQAEFFQMIEESQQRETIRKERKKSAEGLLTLKIDPPLKSAAGWETWADAVRAALMVSYGTRGVPLLYIIHRDDEPNFEFEDWEELAVNCAPLNGLSYESDRKTVHLFLMNNISEDSDAYAYIQPLLLKNNGRLDWKALED
jgi:hypothetical protein